MEIRLIVDEMKNGEMMDISGMLDDGSGYNIVQKNSKDKNIKLLSPDPKDFKNKVFYSPESQKFISNYNKGPYNFLKLLNYSPNEISTYLDNLNDTISFKGIHQRSLSPKPKKFTNKSQSNLPNSPNSPTSPKKTANESSPKAPRKITNESSPKVNGRITNEFSPKGHRRITNEFSPKGRRRITNGNSPKMGKRITGSVGLGGVERGEVYDDDVYFSDDES